MPRDAHLDDRPPRRALDPHRRETLGAPRPAALVAAVRRELTERRATVTLPGGDLLVEWRESNGHVLMTGPVEFEHGGVIDGALLAGEPA